MHYLRQLADGRVDDWVHSSFTKYGRGDFAGPVCEVDVGKDVRFKSTVEFCTVLGGILASCGGQFKAEGSIFAKIDFRESLDGAGVEYDDKSKPKKGVYVADVDAELPGAELARIYDGAPHATILLTLSGEPGKLKCKKKPPKPGGEKNLEFCTGSMALGALPKLKEEVFFGAGDFKKAKVEYRFIIDSLLIPEGMSAADARLSAKRKGKMVRTLTFDGVEKRTEFALEA